MSGTEDMACAVCGHVLNRYSGSFGEAWTHALDADKDHPAVPVDAASIRTIRRCDFCTESHAGWILPVGDITISTGRDDVPDHASKGDWQCCSSCAALIRSDDWDGLAHRALAAARTGGHMEDPELEVFEAIHRAVRVHVTGPLRPDRS